MSLHKVWKWRLGIFKAERWNVTTLWKTLPLFFLACSHLYPGWSSESVGSGRTGKISHQIFVSLPFPSSFFVSPSMFFFFCIFSLCPIVTMPEEWHLKHLVTKMSCTHKRHHAQPSAPSEITLLARTVSGAAGSGSPGSLSLDGGVCCCSFSRVPSGKGHFSLRCPLPHGRDDSFSPPLFLAPPLIVVSVVLWGWFIAFQNCTYSFSFRGVAFSSFWLNLLWTVFLSHCNLILYGFYIENVRPCFFQNTHINAIKPPPGPKAYSVTSENEGFYPLWEEKKNLATSI